MDKLAPIVLFVYNRPEHTQRTLEALKENDLAKESELFVFSDGAKSNNEISKVQKVREIIDNIDGFKNVQVIKANKNKGLANSVISGVTQVINEYGKVIVLEDDLITSKYFLNFMNDALNFYEYKKNIWSISGYTPPIEIPANYEHDIYLSYRANSWGWGTWIDRWNNIDWDIKDFNEFIKDKSKVNEFNRGGNDMTPMLKEQQKGYIDSWAIRWCYNQYKQKKKTIYPVQTFVNNIGLDDGTHGSIKKIFNTDLVREYNIQFEDIKLDKRIVKEFANFYRLNFINYIGFILKRIGIYKSMKRMYKIIKS